jgi:transcription antitermination factor NusG
LCDRVKTCEFPLFPGYVFSRFCIGERWRVIKIPGVIELVHFGNRIPHIEAAEIEALRRVVAAGVPREPLAEIHVGEVVEIISGPLAGLAGPVIQLRNELRLVLTITLLRQSLTVLVERHDIRPVERSAPKRAIATSDKWDKTGQVA